MFAAKYAYKSLIRRKQKNLTIILAIALGVALYVGVQIGNDGLKDSVARLKYDSIHRTDIVINPEGGNFVNESIVNDLSTIPSNDLILGVERRIVFYTGAFYQSSNQIEDNVRVAGIDPNDDLDDDFGVFYDEDGEKINIRNIVGTRRNEIPNVIASTELKDELQLTGSGTEELIMSFDIGNGTFVEIKVNVVDIYSDKKGRGLEGTVSNDPTSNLYIHLQELRDLMILSLQDQVSYIAITMAGVDRSIESIEYETGEFPGKDKINQVKNELEALFESNGTEGVQVYSARIDIAENGINRLLRTTSVLELFVFILNSIALLLIVNVQLMSVEDRKNQTAVLRALGANRHTITYVFLLEASVVGIAGGLIGVLLGIPLSRQIVSQIASLFHGPETNPTVDFAIIIPAMIMGLVLSIITAVAPAIQSTREIIANSLRGISGPKKPKKRYFTIIFGFIFVIIGLLSANNVGKFWSRDGWQTFEDIQAIMLGLGLTLAGIGLLLTMVIDRRIALNISGISLWGLAVFILLVAISWVEPGDPGNTLTFVMFYMVVGATMIISTNYEFLMRSLGKFLFLFPKLRAISQVTTTGMIGRKTRGILVFTIFSIILTLNVFVISTADSIRVGLVDEHDWRSDGVDVVVDVQSPVSGLADDIKNVDSSITHVFSFRKAYIPIYTVDISVLDIQDDPANLIGYVPIIEVNESMMNPDNWGDDSLKISLMGGLNKDDDGEESGAVLDSFNGVEPDETRNHELSETFFDNFFAGHQREINQTYDLEGGRQTIQTENQVMIWGGSGTEILGIAKGDSLYMQTKDGGTTKMYLGALGFDMMGENDLFGIGFLVTPEIAETLPAFDRVLNENVFLVRSTNAFHDDNENDELASNIEATLNSISTYGILLGANTRIVKEEVVEYNFILAAFWDFLGMFSSLGLIIGALGMSIIAIRSVSERIREIGMMRSIGFSRKSVVQGVIIELVVLSLLGLIIGIINGVLLTIALVSNIYETTESYPVMVISLYALGVILISVIAAIIPGYRASRVMPSHALRYTG
ncbi:MAG: ABC transporter permease [Candidatus Heimdallarchaeota archaeon]|nr:ABC transporter permease [Candidatus Heimdallarchaeota archaeon]